jgi:hypothetical protein
MKFLVLLLINLTYSVYAVGDEALLMQKGRLTSPYEACQNTVLVDQKKHEEQQKFWKDFESRCKTKIQVLGDSGLTKLNPLNEGANYLNFAQKVASKVIENLDQSKVYSDCSAQCFTGAEKCLENKKEIICSERKNEVLKKLKVDATRARMELALSTDAPGIINVNIHNVLSVDKDKFINRDLRDFEVGTPNPIGRVNLTERELAEARRRVERDRQKLEAEFKEKGFKNYADWMSIKLMEKFSEHQANYRSIIYQDSPLLAVIDRPDKFEDGSEPVWDAKKISQAFKKLSESAKSTKEKVKWSIDNGKLEFSRIDGEALGHWMKSLGPDAKVQNELLYYVGMKNPVESVLKEDPSLCAIATTMEKRISSKEIQNATMSFAGTIAGAGAIKGVSAVGANVFRLSRALTGAEAYGITGIALGNSNLANSFKEYGEIKEETLANSNLRSAGELKAARDNVKDFAALSAVDVVTATKLTRTAFKLNKELLEPKIQEKLLSTNYKKTKELAQEDEKLLDQCSITNKISSSNKLQCLSFLDVMLRKKLIERVGENFTLTRVADLPSKRDIPKMLQENFTFRDGSTIKTRDIVLGEKLKDNLGRTWRVVEVNNAERSFKLEGNGIIRYNNFLREEFGNFYEYELKINGTEKPLKVFLPSTDEKTYTKMKGVLNEIIQNTPAGYFDYSKEFIFANAPAATSTSGFFVNGLFSTLSHQIWIYPRSSLKEDFSGVAKTFWHEQGHAYFANIINKGEFASNWVKAINKDGKFVTEYAKTNFEEDFCETIAHYILYDGGVKKNSLRGNFKARFEILDEIFNANPDIKKKLEQALFIKKVAGGATIVGAGSSVYYYEKNKD